MSQVADIIPKFVKGVTQNYPNTVSLSKIR